MCIIVYKPANTPMPSKDILKFCFDNNPDGAGFSFMLNNNVQIHKGYMKFNDFYSGLGQWRNWWNKAPFVLHFRISTQGGVNKECCHPFKLSSNMDDLRQCHSFKGDISIAHNGIIDLTSHGWSKTITYSDTMQFITDYLSLIIRDLNYYKDNKTRLLIERLVDSKLAILDKNGHCELIGDFIKDNDIYYSNSSYKERSYKSLVPYNDYSSMYSGQEWDDWDNDYDGYYSWHNNDYGNKKVKDHKESKAAGGWNDALSLYDFDPDECPAINNDLSYCELCVHSKDCWGVY